MIEEPNYINIISTKLGLNQNQVKSVLDLILEGATVPFIARYRKERTGNLDENQIRDILEIKKQEENLFKAKETALNGIQEKGKLTPELENNIIQAKTLKEVEEIYKPYKSKKKTKAMIAEEKGLQPIANKIKNLNSNDFQNIEKDFKIWLKENLKSEEFEKIKDLDNKEIILGALEILSVEIVQNTKLREFLRKEILKNAFIVSKIKGEKAIEKLAETSKKQLHKFEIYKDFTLDIKKIKSYQILAINRGEKLGILSKKIELNDFIEHFYLEQKNIFGYNYLEISTKLGKIFGLKNAEIPNPYKKLYESVENEIFSLLKEKAEDDGIEVFKSNLFELLMTKPSYGKKILAIDPGYRTGSKIVLLDELGNPVKFDKFYLYKETEAKNILKKILKNADIIVIGNGTASGESAELVLSLTDKDVFIVNESGASVYSASKVAQEEFPDLDLTDRGTVSIGRRFIDPLSELVKIPVGSIGVGMYQHDMPEKKLEEKLGYVVEDVVNKVGINVNIASIYVLKNISGINIKTAKKIYKNRPYKNRKNLEKILSDKVYEQAIGFLRIPESDEILDNTDIHPEQYELANKIKEEFEGIEYNENTIVKYYKENEEKLKNLYQDTNLETIKFIIDALKNTGKDPRKNFAHKKASKKLTIEDVKEGDILNGIVRNIMPFGVFVDIGLKNDGLVHISQLANEYVKDPADFVQIGDEVKVKITNIDKEKGKIQLSMKEV